jgi:hypothetical protein
MHVSYKGVAVTPTNPIPTMQADFALVGSMGGFMASEYSPTSGTALVDIQGSLKIVKGIMYGNISKMNIDVTSFGSDYQDFADAMVIPKTNPDVWFMI